MKHLKPILESAYVVGIVLTSVGVAAADATFSGIGFPAGFNQNSTAEEVSNDGQIIAVNATTPSFSAGGFLRDSGTYLPLQPGTGAFVYGISSDGSVATGVVNLVSSAQAYRWTSEDGIVPLNGLQAGPSFSRAWGVSGDGAYIVGEAITNSSFTRAVRWDSSGTIETLGSLPGAIESFAMAASADGNVIVGRSSGQFGVEAFRWTPQAGMESLGFLEGGGSFADADDVTPDGSQVVGGAADADGNEVAFRWNAVDGMVPLGDLPGGFVFSIAHAISADGSIIVGESQIGFEFGSYSAFIWDAAHGMRSLEAALTDDFGLDLTGWRLASATDISDDGTTIVGVGVGPSDVSEGWIVRITPDTVVPSNVLATTDRCDAVEVSWDAVAGAISYEVFRNTIDDFGSAGSLGTTVATNFGDNTASLGTPYFYWVTVTTSEGTSPESESAPGELGIPGDLNHDGQLNGADVQGFTDAATGTFDSCADLAVPLGVIDGADTTAFVTMLLGL